jgi:hypothetical protein
MGDAGENRINQAPFPAAFLARVGRHDRTARIFGSARNTK